MPKVENIKQGRFNLIEKLLFLYLILVPIMQVPWLPLVGQKIQYSDLIFPIIFGVWLIGLLQKRYSIRIDKFDFFILVLLILFALSVAFSTNRLKSGIEYIGILYVFCVYFLIKQLVLDTNTWWRVINLWAIVGLIVSLIGIGGYFGITLTGKLNYFVKTYVFGHFLGPRICSTFRNPNMLATYLHLPIVFGFILLRRRQELKQKSSWIYLLIAICLLGAFLTKTRILAGIFLSIFLILMLPQKSKLLLCSRYLTFVICIFGSLFVFANTVWWLFPINIKTNEQTLSIEFNLTPFTYYNYNKAALAMIKNRPLLGVGIGMYNENLKDYVNKEELASTFHVVYPDYEKGKDPYTLKIMRRGMDPHSTYLGWGAETGLLSLFVIVAMFFYYNLRMIFQFRREANSFNKYIIWCFLAGICGFLLNGFYIDILTMRHFWIFIGMGAVMLPMLNTLKEQ